MQNFRKRPRYQRMWIEEKTTEIMILRNHKTHSKTRYKEFKTKHFQNLYRKCVVCNLDFIQWWKESDCEQDFFIYRYRCSTEDSCGKRICTLYDKRGRVSEKFDVVLYRNVVRMIVTVVYCSTIAPWKRLRCFIIWISSFTIYSLQMAEQRSELRTLKEYYMPISLLCFR